MLTAIYARKSTKQNGVSDEEKSVTRQVDHAKAYAAKKGWPVADEHVYVDDGISGAEFVKRPGFLRLMNALKPKPDFEVLVMSEESRLGREAIETAYALKQLVTAGVRVFFYLEDRERVLESPTDKVMLSLTAFADELEREKASQRTYDAMLRKARAGHVTGGLVFGYDNVEVPSSHVDAHGHSKREYVERRANETQAAIVRRIFSDCAKGKGLGSITKALNADGVPPPRATRRQGKGWSPSSIREILYRDLYRGLIVWNKTKKRNPWGQKHQQSRPASDWIQVEAPALRIVTDELWQAAHERLESTRASYLRGTNGQLWGRPATGLESKYLLTGLTLCAQCGASLHVRSRSHGKRRAFFYACTGYQLRGTAICTNNMEIPMDAADAAVLQQIEADFLRPDVVTEAVRQAVARLRPNEDELVLKRKGLLADQQRVDTELARLSAAIATGGSLASLLQAVKDREQEKGRISQALAGLEGLGSISQLDLRQLERVLRARLADWQGLLQRHVPQARQILKKLLVSRIVFKPESDKTPRAYTFTATGSVRQLLAGMAVPKVLVSPTGFEPVLPA